MLKKDIIIRITFSGTEKNTVAETATKCDTIFIL